MTVKTELWIAMRKNHRFFEGLGERIVLRRRELGLTQSQLAERIGSTQPVISQLEDADYDGHSLSMLRRIADALNQRIEIRFVRLYACEKCNASFNKSFFGIVKTC